MAKDDQAQAAKRGARLRREIAEHDRRYYQEAAPTITDREYDRLYAELVDLENRFPDLVTPNSPTRRVGKTAPGLCPNRASPADAESG